MLLRNNKRLHALSISLIPFNCLMIYRILKMQKMKIRGHFDWQTGFAAPIHQSVQIYNTLCFYLFLLSLNIFNFFLQQIFSIENAEFLTAHKLKPGKGKNIIF